MNSLSDKPLHPAHRLFLMFLISTSLAGMAISLALLQANLFDYRFSLVTLGIASLGLTAGRALGIRMVSQRGPGASAAWIAGSGVAAAILIVTLTATPFGQVATYLLVVVLSAVPFLLVGVGLSGFTTNVDAGLLPRLRWAALAGVIIGLFSSTQLLSMVGPLQLAWWTAIVSSLAALVLDRRPGTVILSGAALVLLGLFGFHIAWDFSLPPHWIQDDKDSTKQYFMSAAAVGQPSLRTTYWNALSRTDLVANAGGNGNWKSVFMNGMVTGLAPAAGQAGVADTESPGTRFPLVAVPLAAGKPKSILVVNSGAGLVFRLAADMDVAYIHDIESNAAIYNFLDAWRKRPGGLAGQSAITLDYGQARGRLRSDSTQYDQVYLTLPLARASTWSLPEPADNYLYTREAFRDFWSHLKPGGMLVVLSGGEIPYMRAMLTAWEILNAEGGDAFVRRAWGYRAATTGPASGPYQYMFMLVKGVVPDDLPVRVRAVADGASAVNLFGPGFTPAVTNFSIFEQPYYILYHPLGLRIAHQALNDYASKNLQALADLGPATDMQPFLFEVVRDLHPFLKWLAAACFVLFAYVFLIPLPSERRLDHPAAADRPPLPVHLGYFLSLGTAVAMEITTLFQQSILWVSESGMVLNCILTGLAIGVGIGLAMFRGSEHRLPDQRWVWISIAAAVVAVLWLWLVPSWNMSGWPAFFQALSVAGLALPIGALGARLLTAGLQCMARQLPALVSWSWVTFGAANVLGVIVALWVAQLHGFRVAWMAAAGCYLVVLGVGLWLRRSDIRVMGQVTGATRV